MGAPALNLLKGTLDVLLLKTLSWGPLHGYAISRQIREATGDALQVEEGALYPALRRLEQRGFLRSEWGLTEHQREARFYELTEPGRRELESGVRDWQRYVAAMSSVLSRAAPARSR
ncbi:MAG TPA: PadR family transcriptional regulator [Thermoanaerobaculia bacterium]|nr:PadR family transcriptional regulator [Thermoanaerobaculia bacterium]